ncbi:membrane-bound lytic murein transglycosylase MltF [Martelella alba]|uniref:Membrane-bound lytic murein transglycosylase F n=1 Tax=Martelella alba TaxID=2590451 RepID=A0ABY2SRR2_9HYPH|nr:membrane-bound lytic murein transglycosylase MltF [Martelella alba]TKI06766.1 membrane-bound lytic murein transglycosylase MltF [Martelella alba]
MKRFKINYVVIGVIAALLTWALWFNVPWHTMRDDKLSEIKSRGTLRVSTLAAPLSFDNTNGKPTGLDYELVKRFADYLGVKLVIHQRANLDELFDDLAGDRADLLAAGLIYNNDRLRRFTTGPAYYYVSQQLVYRLGRARPKSLGALQGRLVVASGSAHDALLQDLRKTKYPDLHWEVSSDLGSKALLQQVAEGKLDYTLADSSTIGLMQRVHPQLAVAFDVSEDEPVTWYLRRRDSDNLSAALLDFYSKMNDEGTIARLEEKYLGHVGSFDYVDTKTFLASIDATLPALQSLFKRYSTEIDWKLLAAISYQESHWDPQAVSPTGVRGLMMLTRATAASLGITDRQDAEQSIRGGALYLARMIKKVPDSIPDDEKIWFALAAYNMGYAHMLDARALTAKQKGNPDSWVDVKLRLPMLSQPRYYQQTTYGYARGQQAYNYVENIRRYEMSLTGYLQEKEKKAALQLAAGGSKPSADSPTAPAPAKATGDTAKQNPLAPPAPAKAMGDIAKQNPPALPAKATGDIAKQNPLAPPAPAKATSDIAKQNPLAPPAPAKAMGDIAKQNPPALPASAAILSSDTAPALAKASR